jgi:hypothetical protein
MSDSEPATTQAPTRRRLLQGVAGCSLPFPSLACVIDPGQVVAERWCALENEQRRLILQWQGVETWLFKHRNWPRLSDAERAQVPEGAQLAAIDDQLAAIDKTYDALLPLLKSTHATTRDGVFARIEVLLHFVVQDEHPDARAILKSCLADLRRLGV